MQARLLGAAALLALVPQVAIAQEDPLGAPYGSLTFDGTPLDLPIELARSQVLVDGVFVNGEGPFRFLLDTGAQGAGRVDASLVAKLGLEPDGQVMGGDGTGRPGRAMAMYRLDSLELGGLRAEGARVLSRDYNERGAAVRGHIDGILGIAFFEQVLLTVDYPGERLRIERGTLPEPDGHEILALDPDVDIPTVTLELAGEEHRAYLDSGAMGPLSLPAELEDSLPLLGEPQVVGQARTVSGAFEIRAAQVDEELAIGRHVTYRPNVVFGGPLRDVIVGGEVLSEYALTIDQTSGRVRFRRGGFPAHGSAPARTSLRAGETRVPMDSVHGRPVVEARIDGQGPFRFVLDTGAATFLLNADLAEELGLAVTGETRMGTPGAEARVPAKTHVLAEVEVGDAVFRTVPASSWSQPEIQDHLGDVRGILGLPLFHDLLVTLDAPAGELVLSHGALGEDALAYTLDGSGLPAFEIDVAGKAIPAHLDTGNPSQLAVPARYVPDLPLAEEPRVIGRGRTASGEFEIRGARLEGTARIGSVVLEDPLLHIHEWNEYANVGGGALAGRALHFDQRHRRLSFGPAGSGAASGPSAVVRKAPGQRKSYGVMLAMTSTGPIELRGVVPDSIAERAGLQAGDSIVELDGVDVNELDAEQRGAAFRASELRLTVLRDGERLEFELAHESD